MAVFTVGPGKNYATITAAINRANQDATADTIRVDPGTYTNQGGTITQPLVLEAASDMVRVNWTVQPSNGKAAFVTRSNVTFDGFEVSGVTVPSKNGAAIRYETGNLTVRDSWFHDNQNGILAGANSSGTVTLENSEFSANGGNDGLTHNVYVNQIGALNVSGSYFHSAKGGHELKSRALTGTIKDSRFLTLNSNDSRNIDISNGGRYVVEGNTFHQGAGSPNGDIVSFGPEGSLNPGSSLVFRNNLAVDDRASGSRLVNNYTNIGVSLVDNDSHGLTASELRVGPGTTTGHEFLASRPALDTRHPWDVQPEPEPTPTPTPPPPPPPEMWPEPSPDPNPGYSYPAWTDATGIGNLILAYRSATGDWAGPDEIVGAGWQPAPNNSSGGTAAEEIEPAGEDDEVSPMPQLPPFVQGPFGSLTEEEAEGYMLALVNSVREDAGLPALVLDLDLSEAAERHGDDMDANDLLSHVGSDGSTLLIRADEAGYDHLTLGENVAFRDTAALDLLSLGGIMAQFAASPGHLENIQDPDFLDVGLDVHLGDMDGESVVWVTQVFGAKAPEDVEPDPVEPEEPVDEPVEPPAPPVQIDWNAEAGRVNAWFAATGNWGVPDGWSPEPETEAPVVESSWDAIAAQVQANFAATGQWFV